MTATAAAAAAFTPPSRLGVAADAALAAAARIWFVTAVIGQWAFVYYIGVFYGPPTLAGHFEAWRRNHNLITGYVAGDRVGNLYFAAHVLLAALITASGALQMIPGLRARAPGFHHWNGRVYVATAFLMALGGLWLVWVRGTYLNVYGLAGSTMLASLIMLSAVMTVRNAMARRIAAHHRWALRLFIVANGVWFQRIGYTAWMILNQGPVGIGKHMDGPFDIVWSFAASLLPLAVLEVYLRTRDRGAAPGKAAVGAALLALTGVMAVGVGGAFLFMWRPML
jgi:hypothetical protein